MLTQCNSILLWLTIYDTKSHASEKPSFSCVSMLLPIYVFPKMRYRPEIEKSHNQATLSICNIRKSALLCGFIAFSKMNRDYASILQNFPSNSTCCGHFPK